TKGERASQPFRPLQSMASWTWIHLALAGLGLLRPPQVIDRHRRGQPTWLDLMGDPEPRVVSDVPPTPVVTVPAPAQMVPRVPHLRARPVPSARRPLPEARRRVR